VKMIATHLRNVFLTRRSRSGLLDEEPMTEPGRKIRILYLMDYIDSVRGGGEQHLIWLLKNISNGHFQKFFLVFSKSDCSPDSFAISPVVLGDQYGVGKRALLKRFLALVRFIRDHEIDLIHAVTPNDELLACYATWLAKRGRVIGNRRNSGYQLNLGRHIKNRLTCRFRIPYLANSMAAVEAAAKKEKIPGERFTVIRNPIAEERLRQGLAAPVTRTELELDHDAFVVGSVATVRAVKGYEVFLNAAKNVVAKHPNARFLIVGEQEDPEYLGKLKNLASELNIEPNVIWYGSVENPYRLLSVFDVAVLSSYSESFSNSVLEYAAFGLPIVASNVGGMKEIIQDGESGFLVPSGDPEQLAEKINTLLEDEPLRKKFGQNAREHVFREFSEQRILEQYQDFYFRVYATEK